MKAHPEFCSGMQDRKPQLPNIANPSVAATMAANIAEFLNRNPEISCR